METQRHITPPSPPRDTYSLDEFIAVYDLGAKRAAELYERFGPSRSKLDTLMVAIRHSTNRKS
ncbi:hypothetical protein N185_37525 [Sinorhizobium sp. GW3]|nr:hypothetical protein N185_37525 [Sinorhizobium sp. GW3]